MSSNTNIQFKRTAQTFSKVADQEVDFGEPIFIDGSNGQPVTEETGSGNSYLVLGRKNVQGTPSSSQPIIGDSPVIRALTKKRADTMVFFDEETGGIIDIDGNGVPVNRASVEEIKTFSLSKSDQVKYHLVCQPDVDSTHSEYNKLKKFSLDSAGIYITGNGVMHGGAWNDYAENRKILGPVKPGQVVCEFGDGSVTTSMEKYQACPYVVSDTYGFLLSGEEPSSVPVAVAGRALVYINNNKEDIKVGDCVCADVDGMATIMNRTEIINYPDRILGIVSEIPTYEEWNSVAVDGRVWIKVK